MMRIITQHIFYSKYPTVHFVVWLVVSQQALQQREKTAEANAGVYFIRFYD